MQALVEGQYRSYTNQFQLRAYAKRWNFNYKDVETIGQAVPLADSTLLPVAGLDVINQIAAENNMIERPLTAGQLHELVHPMGNKPN